MTLKRAAAFVSAVWMWAQAFCAVPTLVDMETAVCPGPDASSPAGIWQAGGAGAVFSIIPVAGREGCFDLVLLDSPDLAAGGRHFGSMHATGTPHRYDAALLENPSGARRSLRKTRNFIFTFSPDGSSLVMTSYSKGKQVSVLRLLPYIFRVSVKDVNTRPNGIDGAVRIAPVSLHRPVTL